MFVPPDIATVSGSIPAPKDRAARDLLERWEQRGLTRAGLDDATWLPERGFPANAENMRRVSNYYGGLFAEHPSLLWAGMASIVSAQFLAAFHDMEAVRQAFSGVAFLGRFVDAHVQRTQRQLLSMQRSIFRDQSMMHEAYLGGGIKAVEQLAEHGLIDDVTLRGWRDIDAGSLSGSARQVADGARAILFREQVLCMGDDYDDLAAGMGWLRPMFTALAGTLIPGSRPPERSVLRDEHGRPRGDDPRDLTGREFRWHYVSTEVAPAFFRAVEQHPAGLRRLAAMDALERIDELGLRRAPNGLTVRAALAMAREIVSSPPTTWPLDVAIDSSGSARHAV